MRRGNKVCAARSARKRRVILEELEPRVVLSTLGLEGGVELLAKTEEVSLKEYAGVYRGGTWYFDQDDQGLAAEEIQIFGIPGDKPVAGYFDEDPHAEVAIVRDGIWYFDLNHRGGVAEKVFAFGLPGDTPLAGKWVPDGSDGRAIEHAAVFRDSNATWYFDHDGAGQAAEASFAFGLPGDLPVAGDFDGDGLTDAGVYRNGTFHLDLDRAGGNAEASVVFGMPGDQPVVGDFDGDGSDELAVQRGHVWYFDLDGNGGVAEKSFAFGVGGDIPLAAKWQGTGAGKRSDDATTEPGADPGPSGTTASLASLTVEKDAAVAENNMLPTYAPAAEEDVNVPAADQTDSGAEMNGEEASWDLALLEATGEMLAAL